MRINQVGPPNLLEIEIPGLQHDYPFHFEQYSTNAADYYLFYVVTIDSGEILYEKVDL